MFSYHTTCHSLLHRPELRRRVWSSKCVDSDKQRIVIFSFFNCLFFAASQIKYTLFQGYQICLLLFLSKALESCDISLRASQTDIPKVILTCCQARLFHIRPPELRQTSAKAGKLASLRTHNNFSLSLLLMCPGLFLVPLFLFYSHQNHHSS